MKLMSKDLEDANNEGAGNIKALLDDQEDAKALIGALNDFISTSTTELKGNNYDKVRAQMEQYVKMLETRISISNSLIDAIKNANNTMLTYMDGETVLDEADLPELKESLQNEKNARDSAYGTMNSSEATEDEKSAAKDAYDAACIKIKELERLIGLIEGLSDADSAAYDSLSGNESDIGTYNKATLDMNVISFNANL